MAINEINDALAKLFDLPRLTQGAVIVLKGGCLPRVRLTRLILTMDGELIDEVRQVTERYELVKLGDGGTANGNGGANEQR